MSFDGKYARPIIACDPEVHGTAICHNDGKCFACELAALHDTEKYLKAQAEALGCRVEIGKTQLDRMAETMSIYGFPLCLCKAFAFGIIEPGEVRCPCPEAPKDIAEKGRCHCGIFRKVEIPLFFQGLIERAKEAEKRGTH